MGSETKITVDDTPGFEAGAYLTVAGGPWWKTVLRITHVDSNTQFTVRWEWWREPWFQIPVFYALLWANFLTWAGWNASI
jgi:hypothetical protein